MKTHTLAYSLARVFQRSALYLDLINTRRTLSPGSLARCFRNLTNILIHHIGYAVECGRKVDFDFPSTTHMERRQRTGVTPMIQQHALRPTRRRDVGQKWTLKNRRLSGISPFTCLLMDFDAPYPRARGRQTVAYRAQRPRFPSVPPTLLDRLHAQNSGPPVTTDALK